MKYTNRLEIGDWIFEKTKDGITIGIIKEMIVDEYTRFNTEGNKILFDGKGGIKSKGMIRVMNSNEIKKFKILKNKLKILKGLDDKPLTEVKYR